MAQQTLCSQFEPTTNESSATICKWCGQEKFLHTSKDITMAQQTAVEFLNEKLMYLYFSPDTLLDVLEWIEQAKQMEKEQMKQAVMRSVTTWHPLRKLFEKQFEEYYNETYNK